MYGMYCDLAEKYIKLTISKHDISINVKATVCQLCLLLVRLKYLSYHSSLTSLFLDVESGFFIPKYPPIYPFSKEYFYTFSS